MGIPVEVQIIKGRHLQSKAVFWAVVLFKHQVIPKVLYTFNKVVPAVALLKCPQNTLGISQIKTPCVLSLNEPFLHAGFITSPTL